LGDAGARVIAYLLLILFSAPFLLPLVWLVSTALKQPDAVYVYPPQWIPNPARWENFPEAWTTAPFDRYFVNTVITTVFPLLGEVFVSAIVAYSFSRVRWPGRDLVFSLCVATMLMPWVATFIPVFLLFKSLGWVNTFLPLIVPSYFGTPFYIFMLRQFMLTLPRELEDAARVDGANTFGIFGRIILPLLGPSLATVAIFSFMQHWNSFMGPMIYLHSRHLKTLSLGLAAFESAMMGGGQPGGAYSLVSSRLHLLMAAALLMNIPCIIVFVLFQKYFVRDALLSGLKG
jgi:multiple sugar transport system permease protein/sn-glycerol 3-phosphate transport system permease protein